MDTLILANAMLFLSTLSLRRATFILAGKSCGAGNFYPRSPCGERLFDAEHLRCQAFISIHALLAESDKLWDAPAMPTQEISIHALLAESDPFRIPAFLPADRIFLSTLSLRRATAEQGQNQK